MKKEAPVFPGPRAGRTSAASVIALLVAAPGVAQQAVQGLVVDAQGRVISGATVTIICPAVSLRFRANAAGQFTTPRVVDPAECGLSVAQTGFTAVVEPPGSWTSPARIELHLAPVRVRIDVIAKEDVGIASAQSAVVSVGELEAIGNSATDWLRYARLVAGATGSQGRLLVDGVPATTLPPTAAISLIAIDSDPFSAEYAAPNEGHVNIVTRGPDRTLRWSVGGLSLGFGGQNPLVPGQSGRTRSANVEGSVGLPGVPVVLLGEAVGNHQALPVPIRALSAQDQPLSAIGSASTQTTLEGISVLLFYSSSTRLELRGSYQQSDSSLSDADVGGLIQRSAASDSRSSQREARLTFQQTNEDYRVRGGVTFAGGSTSTAGSLSGPMISVPGSLTSGAAALSSETGRQTWTANGVLERRADTRPWDVGMSAVRSFNTLSEHPNPFGTLLFPDLLAYAKALDGAQTGTLFVETGNGLIRTTTLEASAFFQSDLVHRRGRRLRLGLRADYQSRGGLRFSPRLSGTARLWGFAWAGGVGTFSKNWPDDLFAKVLVRDSSHLSEQVQGGTGLNTSEENGSAPGSAIVSSIDARFRRRRDTIGRASIQRKVGNVDYTAEYTFTHAVGLPGTRRIPVTGGWIDDLSSDYGLRSHQVHVRAQYGGPDFTLSAHYEWTRSRDSSAGAFATEPAGTPPLWAPSADVSPHQVGLVAGTKIVGAFCSVVASARTGAPYDIALARDLVGDGLFVDRNGLPRNSGLGPPFRSLDVYASRSIVLPASIARVHGPRTLHVGIQANNVLGWRNHLAFGSVLGTPLFGQPLGALPERALRFWITM